MLRFFIILLYSFQFLHSEKILLKNLDYDNPLLKLLRSEVKDNLRLGKTQDKEPLPLKFFQYKVVHGDNFFKIMARTGMNIDTLSSVNALSSPQDIRVGMMLTIPNMRGVYDIEELPKSEKSIQTITEKHNILAKNILYDSERSAYFFSGKTLSKIEKSFFYGLIFTPPLNEGSLTSGYGVRLDPFTKKKTFHGGLDIAAPKDALVFASAEGEVIFSGKKGGYGNLIVLKHIMGYQTRYGHLNKSLVKMGDHVTKGQNIGKVGSTGRATGNHLHFEVIRFQKNQKPMFYTHM